LTEKRNSVQAQGIRARGDVSISISVDTGGKKEAAAPSKIKKGTYIGLPSRNCKKESLCDLGWG